MLHHCKRDLFRQLIVRLLPSVLFVSFDIFSLNVRLKVKLKVKVKQSRYRPGVAQRVPGS
jgi:hypothetical protein